MSWRPRRPRLSQLLPPLLVLMGIGLFLYPVAATQFNNSKQREFAAQYNTKVAEVPPVALGDALEAARAYNRDLPGVPILDPWLTSMQQNPTTGEYGEYSSKLSGMPAMARLRVPRLGIDLPIKHGTTDAVLATGVGHLYGTSLPVGGVDTHSVLTSHTGLVTATLFDKLIDAAVGDVMTIDVFGETLAYEVDSISVVLPTDVEKLKVESGKDIVTLVTCTPYGVNSHRLLVRAHRIPYDAQVATVVQDAGGARWQMDEHMWWLLGGAALGVVALTWLLVSGRRRRPREDQDAALDGHPLLGDLAVTDPAVASGEQAPAVAPGAPRPTS